MSSAVTLNHFVWPVGELLPLKNNGTTPDRTTRFSTVLAENQIKWSMGIRYHQQGEFQAIFFPQGHWVKYPGIKLCYRFVLQKEIDDAIFGETSGHIDRNNISADGYIALRGSVIKIKSDRVTEGRYVFHLWLDVFADQQVPAKRHNEVLAFSDDSALLARFRSALPRVIAGAESPYFDLVIKIGQEKKFYVHRLVLAAHSPVFDTMLSTGSWKERNEGEIAIKDADAKSIQDLLHFLYGEKLPEDFNDRTTEEVSNLVDLAEKYNIRSLKEIIESFLMLKVCSDQERFDQWTVSEIYQMPQLKQVCELILSTKLSMFRGQPLSDSVCELNSQKLSLRQNHTTEATV